jgi:F-type H+-transporting ATPase subunit epsilon
MPDTGIPASGIREEGHMATFQLNIISPRGRIFAGEVESLVVPGSEGELGILAGHAPMISLLKLGTGKVDTGSSTQHYVFGVGVLEVTKKDVVVLTDIAEKCDTHEAARAKYAELAKTPAAKGER